MDTTSSLASDDDREAVCYLCLGGGVDDDDAGSAVAARLCSSRHRCRISSTSPALLIMQKQKVSRLRGMQEFVKPWIDCPSCHQEYQTELAIDIANKFVPFVRRQYPDDTQMQVESPSCETGCSDGHALQVDTCTNEGSRSNCKCTDIFNWSDEMRGITAA